MNYDLDNPFPLASAKYSGPGLLQQYQQQAATPYLARSALSERERDIYRSWFNELDPFSTGASVSNTAVLQFLTNAYLPAETLGKIFAFFESAHDGLSEGQFYAILRLVAHAQNGRTITRDLVFIEPPVPRFQLQPVDAYLKSSLRNPASTPTPPAFSPSLLPSPRPNIKSFASLSANPTIAPSYLDDASVRATNSQQLAQSWMFNAPAKPNSPNPATTNGIDLLGEFVPASSAPAKSTDNWWESLVTEPPQPTSVAATAVLSPSLNRSRTPKPLETGSNSYFPPAQLIQTPMATSPQAGIISPNNPFFNAASNARTAQSPSTSASSPNDAAFTSITTTVSALKAEEPAFFSKRFSTGSIDPRTHNQRQQALLTQQRQDLLSLYPVLSPKSEPDKPKSPAPKPSSPTNERTASPIVAQSPTSPFAAFAPKATDAAAVTPPTSASPPPLPQRASFDPDSFKRLMMTTRRLTDDISASPTDAQNPFTALRQIAEGSVVEGGPLASPTRGSGSPGLKDGGVRQRPSNHSRKESSSYFADLADFGMGAAAGVTLGQAQAQSPVLTSAPVTASPSPLVAATSSPPPLPPRQSFTTATTSPLQSSSPPPLPPRQSSATTILPAPAPALAPASPISQSILSPGPEFPFDERFPDINALESAAALTIPADSPTPSTSPTPNPANIRPNKQGAPAPPLPSQITKPIVLKHGWSTSPISNSPPQAAAATVLDVIAPTATRPPPLPARPQVGSGSSSPSLSASPAAFLQQQQRIYSPVPFTQSPQPIGITTPPALPSRSPARTPKVGMQMPKQPSPLGATGARSTDNSDALPRAPLAPSSALEELQRDLAYLQKDQEALARRVAGGAERRG